MREFQADENPRVAIFDLTLVPSGTLTKYHGHTTPRSRVVKKHDPTQLQLDELHRKRQLSTTLTQKQTKKTTAFFRSAPSAIKRYL
jgi:hypothetical protein